MRIWVLRGLTVLYAASISVTLVACGGEGGGGGCGGGQQTSTSCGEGTKKVKSDNGYKCVPN